MDASFMQWPIADHIDPVDKGWRRLCVPASRLHLHLHMALDSRHNRVAA
jgi:hypothetical protein